MFILNVILGCLSYAAAFLLAALDFVLYGFHRILANTSNKFLADGDSLTGWKVGV